MKAFLGSMTGRVFITLLLGILISATLTQLAADLERQRVIEQQRDQHLLERAEQLVMATEIVPTSARSVYLSVANRPGLRLEVAAPQQLASAASWFARSLAARLGDGYSITSAATRPASCDMPHQQTVLYGLIRTQWRGACELLNVRLRDGQELRLSVLPPRSAFTGPETDYRTVIGLFLVSIGALAYVVARMTTRPLKVLARAAQDLGQDINRAPLALSGASEIRQASAAFNAMQARIRQYIFQRTQMLAAITHDLQTPLTRMRLRLEKVSDIELQERLIGDLSAMQEMVREGLVLARSMDTTENMHMLDLDSLLEAVCADAVDAGQQVELKGQAGLALLGRPLDLRRCLGNLIDNAVKYGRDARVCVDRINGAARVRVRDSGPGIPAGELARVFDPFYRVETSRSRESGGTGLGLTIARNIAEQHGGSIALANHPEGGLEVTLVLPEYYPNK
ncbi:ATP-binding protein [Massilia yuzhufengensis]|uniref:histidine kinase n=1 Tax=Massilia yuzhufengensis TaxID=1164594 RepID=A0A1I1WAP1_9BURK|nr:ATP-binding protein [Massilia yuzhufengensis]SFD91468.1 Signal transduction histidine kinase [Massilia yuzhufengensis]